MSPVSVHPSAVESPLLTQHEAAAYLRCSERYLWQLSKDGKVNTVRFGRSVRYAKDDLDVLIASMKASA